MASIESSFAELPGFDDLPAVEGMPQGCAWGIFDRNGEKDKLGTLNLLTPEVVKAAALEVKDGVSISLKQVGPSQLKPYNKTLTRHQLATQCSC